MTTMRIMSKDLRAAINSALPVLARNDLLPTILQARFIVEGGQLYIVYTDRFIIAVHPIKGKEVEDKRRVSIGFTDRQLKLIRAWITHLAPPTFRVRISDSGLTLDGGDKNELFLRPTEYKFPDILPLVRAAWDKESATEISESPKVWNPALLANIRGARLYSSGPERKAGLFSGSDGVFGIIMPIRYSIENEVDNIRLNSPELFSEEESENVDAPA